LQKRVMTTLKEPVSVPRIVRRKEAVACDGELWRIAVRRCDSLAQHDFDPLFTEQPVKNDIL
jgi:hypothetical protein